MSPNNKPKSSVTPVSQHLQNKGNTANPKDVIAAANAQQAAKTATDTTTKTEDQPKAPATTNKATDKPKDKKASKRLSRKEWIAIIERKDKENLTAEDIASEYNVSANNVYQWSSKLKAEAKTEMAKTGDKDIVATAKASLGNVDNELKEFDDKVAEAKKLVDNATAERKKIEDKKGKYQSIIDMFTEDKAAKKA